MCCDEDLLGLSGCHPSSQNKQQEGANVVSECIDSSLITSKVVKEGAVTVSSQTLIEISRPSIRQEKKVFVCP